jgi:hypothetical protein
MKGLIDAARRRTEAADALRASYQRLVDLTFQVVRQAQQVETALAAAMNARGHRLWALLQTFIPRVQQVMCQTTGLRNGSAERRVWPNQTLHYLTPVELCIDGSMRL